jgi:tetratricopeptide (TPR) repeat protein
MLDDVLKPRRAVSLFTTNHPSARTVIPASYAEQEPPAFIKYFQEGMRLSDEGDWRSAVKHFEMAVNLRPNFFHGNFNLGATYGNLGDDEHAYKFFRKAVDLHSDEPLAQYYLGLTASMLGKVDVSLTALTKAERLGLELTAVRVKELAWAYFTVGFELTSQAERERQSSPRSATITWRKVDKVLSRAVELHSALVEAHFLLGKAYSHLGSQSPQSSAERDVFLDQALHAFERATSADPTIASWAYTEMGVLSSCHGDVTKSLELFEKAAEADPNNIQAMHNLGLVLLMTQQWKSAVGALQRVIAIDPEHPSAHRWLGTAFASNGEYGQAETALKQALKIDPEDTQALFNLGVVAYKQGRLEDAEDFLQHALKIAPEDETLERFLAELQLDRLEREQHSLPKQNTVPISSLFVFQNPAQIVTFVFDNQFLLGLLREAHRHIHGIFGSDTQLSLRLWPDPDYEDAQTLYIEILTKMSVDDAFPLLERLDEEWWIDTSEQASGKLNIKLQYI